MTALLGKPLDLSVSFSEAGQDCGVRIEGVGESIGRRVTWSDLEAVGADLARLRHGGADLGAAAADAAPGGNGCRTELARLGERLFACLFNGPERALFGRADDDARREGRALRVLIKLAHGSPLEGVPWEILHDGCRFLAKDPRCAVVRYYYDPQRIPAFEVPAPLRVLVTTACPPPQPPLDEEEEVEAVLCAYRWAGKLVEPPVVERNVSLERLEDLWRGAEARRKPFHVWHHRGHGHYTESRGEPRFLLSLERRGVAEYVTVDQLSEVVGTCPDLRLAVLNVCHGGAPVGLVPELARLNVPVVIGYPSPVASDAAYRFAAALHQTLLDTPVEVAVSLARRALATNPATELDWSLPLLCSRRSDWGPIVRWPARTRRVPRGVVVEASDIDARHDVTIVGVENIGTSPHAAAGMPVRVKTSNIRGDNVQVHGLRNVSGFSEREIRLRERRMQELLAELASTFAAGGGRDGT